MIILLTGCINPNGMAFTALSNKKERQKQYIKAIEFYLRETNYPIIFVENSGTDISSLFLEHIESGRFECITFIGNHDKKRGKGYGECEILNYALSHSKMIENMHNCYIAKITGRLIIRNIDKILCFHRLLFPKRTVFFTINTDFTFSDSRLIIAPIDFYHVFLRQKDEIDDNSGYFFEHALLDTIKNEEQYKYSPFFLIPIIEGSSGSTGYIYEIPTHTLRFKIKYFRLALTQWYRFKKLYH